MLNAPCKCCEQREVGCHAKCAKYQAFRAECDKRAAERKEQAELGYNPRWSRLARIKFMAEKRRQ